ncbi:MAG TPA: DUF5606 domain-containing protein [Salinivirgaceae bacterium]|nr:DUF5606 domain-containing protein [Salinivirgaceae bacterium]
MTLKEILAVSGQPGLYKLVASAKRGIIVENIETKKRVSVAASAKVSSLNDIAIFTTGEDKPLVEVLKLFREKFFSGQAISHKSDEKQLRALFVEILPDYDQDRVYLSDIKKVVQWYNLLQATDLLHLLDVKEETASGSESDNK